METAISRSYLVNSPLEESLVLSFDYDPRGREARLVYDYAAQHFASLQSCSETDGPKGVKLRDFRHIVFREVEFVTARSNADFDYGRVIKLLRKKVKALGVVIERAEFRIVEQQEQLRLVLSSDFEVTIRFVTSVVTQRLCRPEEISESEWRYFDVDTGEEVDFFRPFL